MANWEPQHPGPPSRWPAPGIFVNMEFGVSFSQSDPPHMASMKYTSRNMRERMDRQQQGQLLSNAQPPSLMPEWEQQRHERQQRQQQHREQHQQRPRRLGISIPSTRERGRSAPPPIHARDDIVSPVSPISTYRSSIAPGTMGFTPLTVTRERPLPPVPSNFRLGEADMPWSTDPWYRPEEADIGSPVAGIELEHRREQRRTEDPQRVRELEDLHQAMMTVDSLDSDGWETWTWDSDGGVPRPGGEVVPRAPQRAPRSLGWAVSRTEEVPDLYAADSLDRVGRHTEPQPPPPYVVSQWENTFGITGRRPRSAYA